ncbi:MAG: hypothetical protein QM765_43505 [Myxococcales bacterium]
MRRTRALLPTWTLLTVACGSACAGPSELQLVLTPTPEIAPASDIVGRVDRIAVVVGSPQGLTGVTAEGPTAGGGEARDLDGDGKLDVLFRSPPIRR